jgi:hypothetical protein
MPLVLAFALLTATTGACQDVSLVLEGSLVPRPFLDKAAQIELLYLELTLDRGHDGSSNHQFVLSLIKFVWLRDVRISLINTLYLSWPVHPKNCLLLILRLEVLSIFVAA